MIRRQVERTTTGRSLRILGPWPFSPGGTFVSLLIFFIIQNLYIALFVPEYARCSLSCIQLPKGLFPGILEGANALNNQLPVDLVSLLFNTVVTATTAGLMLAVLNRLLNLRFFERPRIMIYVLGIASTALVTTLARVTFFPPQPKFPGAEAIILTASRLTIVLLIIHALLGRFAERYETARAQAEEALLEVRRQQALVIDADEKSRREVASFLHDRVQAGLLVTAMRLRAATAEVPPGTSPMLEQAIQELEHLRSEDVRGASRRLSPDFASVGLDSALHDLAASWKAAMNIDIQFGPSAHKLLHDHPDDRYITAIYRIVEQALLNSAAHGNAQNVSIRITAEGQVQVDICDDGHGLSEDSVPGSGSAIIDAWVAALGGVWSLEGAQGHGVVMRVVLPLP